MGNLPKKELVNRWCLLSEAYVPYLYWDNEHNTLFKAPGVEIKKN